MARWLLLLAALFSSVATASVPRVSGVWESNPPAAVLLAVDGVPPPELAHFHPTLDLAAGGEPAERFRLLEPGATSLTGVGERESFHPLQGVELVDTESRRGPPESYPETRVWVIEVLGSTFVGEATGLSVELRPACGDFSCGVVSGNGKDPLGLAVKKTRSRTALTPGRWSVPPGTMAPAPVGVDPPGFIPGGVVDVASATSTGNAAVELGELRQIGLDDVTGMEVLSSHYPGGEGERGRVQAIASKVSPLQKPAMVGLLLMTPFMGPVPGGGTPLQLGLKFESMTAAAPVLESAGTAVAVETGSTAISPASFGYKTIAEDATLHRLWEGAMKGAATSSRGNKYQELLALWETGGTPSQELLEQGFGTVNQRFLSAAREAGYDIAQVHHWNFRKASFPNQVFDPRNLVPTPSRAVHQSMHQATTSGTNIWADDIAVEHQLAIDDSHYPLAPRTP